MKRVFVQIMTTILFATAVTACSSSNNSDKVSGSVSMRLPWVNQEQGTYSEQVVSVDGLTSLYELSGQYAHFYMSPGIVDSHLIGFSPKVRIFKSNKNIYVPTDTMSQQMATVYAHMERLAQLDQTLGVSSINHWPRDIGVGVRMIDGMENNAFYDGTTDSMLFVPYSEQNLPIAVNAGILAHEHFHSLFYKLVVKPSQAESKSAIWSNQGSNHATGIYEQAIGLKDNTTETTAPSEARDVHFYYHMALLRGLNEGIADFWGWVYTGDADFLGPSLPTQKGARRLDVKTTSLISSAMIQRQLGFYINAEGNTNAGVVAYAYMLGTQYSRILKGFADLYAHTRSVNSVQARQAVAKMLLKVLPTFRTDFKVLAEGQNDFYLPGSFLKTLAASVPDLQQSECQYLADLINSSQGNTAQLACQGPTNWTLQPAPPATSNGRVLVGE